jgi:hypothetical protein
VTDLGAQLRAFGFNEAWIVDTEFTPQKGAPALPLCLSALDILSGRRIELWLIPPPPCSFRMTRDVLFIMYAADADAETFITLGWPAPLMVLDPRVEWMRIENGGNRFWDPATKKLPKRFKLTDGKRAFGLQGISEAVKKACQERAAKGPPFTEDEERLLLRYCRSDVDLTYDFLKALWGPAGLGDRRTFAQARIRGRSMTASARHYLAGLSIDVATYQLVRDNAASVRAGLAKENHSRLPMFREDGSLDHKRVIAWAHEHELLSIWPRTAGGKLLATDKKTLEQLGESSPIVGEFLSFSTLLKQIRKLNLPIGEDGRNRTALFPFSTLTGRNAPSGREYILCLSKALRPLIQPQPGRAIAVLDYSAQELRIAAHLSRDGALIATTQAGDSYLGLAKAARLALDDDTPETNPQARKTGKVMSLAMLFGAGPGLLTSKGLDINLARGLLMQQRRKFAAFYRWSDALACMAHQGKQLTTRLGWTLRFRQGSGAEAPDRTGRNFPMQGHGAEIMRLVMIRATEAGLRVGGALHDGFTIEAAAREIEAHAQAMRAIMERSALDVIGGVIPVDVEIARWPDRYPVEDKHCELFERIVQLAKDAEQ